MDKGAAVIKAAQGKTFDPAQIPGAVRDAGFTSPEIGFTARGILVKEGAGFALKIPGLRHSFRLEGEGRFEALKGETDLIGKTIEISGNLLLGREKRAPAMTVESFKPPQPSPSP